MTHPSLAKVCFGIAGLLGLVPVLSGCGSDTDDGPDGSGGATAGAPGSGGRTGSGGAPGSGGSSDTGGKSGTGGAGSGGRPGTGGTAGGGGKMGTGGALGTGGKTGGAPGTGGRTGGAPGTGGSSLARDGGNDALPGREVGDVVPDPGVPGVRLQGRFDSTDATKPAFSWSGSAMLARFEGTGATLRIDGSPNYFTVVVDGVVSPKVLHVVSGTTQYALATGLAAGTHEVSVWKRTEGTQGDNRFLGIDVTSGQLLAPPAVPTRRIEIFGDSISAGYGLDGQGPNCPWSADTENHYLTYGALTARELDADLHTIAWSGIGMYRNYGEDGPSKENMPVVYGRILASTSTSKWDFGTWQPHAVVINLGTNDASTKGDPGTPYRTNYLEFVRTLRGKYPDTFFVLTVGPMLDGEGLKAIKGHIQAVIQTLNGEGDNRMSFLEFPIQSFSDGVGCDSHPGPTTNEKMARQLVAELKTRLAW